jgi:hypothetical protein
MAVADIVILNPRFPQLVSRPFMNVLLFSMPDSFEHTPSLTMRFPNGALASLAGNVDAHHDVAVADLVLVQHAVPQTVRELVIAKAPDVVGLSVMTFQRKTAYKVIALVRALRPEARIVVGGYDPSLAPEAYEEKSLIVSDEVDEYDGTTAVVRTEHLSADDIEFMRWKAERWMKVRHLPAALAHDPGYVARNGLRMLRHTFRGTTLRTWLRLESQRDAFRRYKAIRGAEREFFPDVQVGSPGLPIRWQASAGKSSELGRLVKHYDSRCGFWSTGNLSSRFEISDHYFSECGGRRYPRDDPQKKIDASIVSRPVRPSWLVPAQSGLYLDRRHRGGSRHAGPPGQDPGKEHYTQN